MSSRKVNSWAQPSNIHPREPPPLEPIHAMSHDLPTLVPTITYTPLSFPVPNFHVDYLSFSRSSISSVVSATFHDTHKIRSLQLRRWHGGIRTLYTLFENNRRHCEPWSHSFRVGGSTKLVHTNANTQNPVPDPASKYRIWCRRIRSLETTRGQRRRVHLRPHYSFTTRQAGSIAFPGG
jgi:hypothetical protein